MNVYNAATLVLLYWTVWSLGEAEGVAAAQGFKHQDDVSSNPTQHQEKAEHVLQRGNQHKPGSSQDKADVLHFILHQTNKGVAGQKIIDRATLPSLITGERRPEGSPMAPSEASKAALSAGEIVRAAMKKYGQESTEAATEKHHVAEHKETRVHGHQDIRGANQSSPADREGLLATNRTESQGKEKTLSGSPKQSHEGKHSAEKQLATNLKLVPYDEFVQSVAHKKHAVDKEQGNWPKEKALAKGYGERTKQKKEKLILFQNVTEEAEKLKIRLKEHKLQLTSYVDALNNLSHALEDDEMDIQRVNADMIKERVSEILNLHRRLNQSQPREEAGGRPSKVSYSTKEVQETLLPLVNRRGLKDSQAFWEKKGGDVADERVRSNEDALREMKLEDQLNLGAILTSDSYQWKNETATYRKHPDDRKYDDRHIHGYHAARLGDDKLVRVTLHERFLVDHLVSGRIHGDILAPPPERCSITANMKRYRPPDDTLTEHESLMYRVNLAPERKAALEGAPMDYLDDYKNPCWLSKITDDKGSLWYDYTETGIIYQRMSYLYEMRLSRGNNWRMRCLPYLFFVGVTKCGTTDLYTRLLGHPEIMRPSNKEPMWWNRLTLGMPESLRKPFRHYVDFFDEAAELIRRKVIMKDGKPYHPGITLDATPANLWDYDCWTDIPGNRGLSEPKYTLAHSIRKLIPNARILMILREPTSRLYSQFRMKSHMEPPHIFHSLVVEAVANFNQCLQTRTLRSCAYDYKISKYEFHSPGGVFLRASLYYVFVKDWLGVFPRDRVKILRMEDYHNDTAGTLVDVFDFLELSALPADRLKVIAKQHPVNTRSDHRSRSLAPMMRKTRAILDDFFRPFNKMLADLLHDGRFTWSDVVERDR